MSPTVFVTSATGTQGGSLVRKLRDVGWDVHTTVRDPTSPAAQALLNLGVTIVPGDWDDESALAAALSGCQKLFLNLFPDFRDPSIELKRAKTILSLARSAGVEQVIYSSDFALEADDAESLVGKIRQSKRNIEEVIRSAGFDTWTIVRPGFFMANFVLPKVHMYPGALEGVFTLPYPGDTLLPLIDHEDIGKFAAAVFENPQKFHGQTIRIAGDVISVDDVLKSLSRVSGRNIRGIYLSEEEIKERGKSDMYIAGQVVVTQMAGLVKIDEVKSWGVPFGIFTGFLEREEALVRTTYRDAPI